MDFNNPAADTATEPLRRWQRPLSQEQIAVLAQQFAAAKEKIDAMWGPRLKPWHARRDGDA